MTQNRQKIADIKLKVEPGPEPAPIQVAKTKITATPAPTPGVTPSRAVSRSSVSRIVGFSVVVCVVRSACGSFPVVCFYGFGLVCFVFVGFCVVVRLVVVPVRGSLLIVLAPLCSISV